MHRYLLLAAATGTAGVISGTQIRPGTIPLRALNLAAVRTLEAGRFTPANVIRVVGPQVTIQPLQSATSQADCPPGYAAVGGGGAAPQTLASFPSSPNGANPPTAWVTDGFDPLQQPEMVQAYAVCAN